MFYSLSLLRLPPSTPETHAPAPATPTLNPAIAARRAFSASRRYVFFNAKLPSAATEIFAGLQIGVVLALIGAVVAEFIASERGLGYMIDSAAVSLNVSNMFAGVIILAVMGVVGTAIVRALQRRVVFWEGGASRVNLEQAS